ncbi:MAG: hypothetical protein IT521_06850 [Burkholderiales bacterium]|nr:hypothetical protein [Burkholderiales bacterium]
MQRSPRSSKTREKHPARAEDPYGPDPWQQKSWDARAAANFIFGGMGSGLIVFAVLSGAAGAPLPVLLLAGLALVGFGLFSVALEIGRPLRALNVFRNPRTSWMAREAWTALALVPATLAAAAGVPGCDGLALVLAFVFVYCQARMLLAAKGIPAWREPLLLPLLIMTGMAEGGGMLLIANWQASVGGALVVLFAACVLARGLLWIAYRRRANAALAPRAAAALDRAGRVLLLAGTLLPALLVAAGALSGVGSVPLLQALAGVAAAAAGAYFKYTLVIHAGFNQGFALPRFPVRGARG